MKTKEDYVKEAKRDIFAAVECSFLLLGLSLLFIWFPIALCYVNVTLGVCFGIALWTPLFMEFVGSKILAWYRMRRDQNGR